MSDIVEQAARVIGAGRLILRDNGKRNNEKIAQALADAGLLADLSEIKVHETINPDAPYNYEVRDIGGNRPRTVPTRDVIVDVQDLEMSLDRVVIRDADGDIWERQGELETERGTFAAWLGTHTGVKPSIDIPLPATVIYVPGEFTGERPTRQEVWQEAFSAGYMDGQTYTVPTREEIIDVLVMSPLADTAGTDLAPFNRAADAVRALMNGQPTVEEVKAQALEEAADAWHAENAGTSPRAYRWLQHRAQQHRGRK